MSHVNRITSLINESTINIVIETGIRRSGKSFIAKQVAKKLFEAKVPRKSILIINLEDERLIDRNYDLLLQIYATYKENINRDEKSIIIIDEAQEADGWERFIRGLSERGEAKFIITGSLSKLLNSEFSTLLSGRHVVVYIHPLNLSELKEFTHKNDALIQYIDGGGFPAIVLSGKKADMVSSYFNTIILKDVIQRFGIRKEDNLVRLAKFYITSIGSKITFNSISKLLTMSVKTVYNFPFILKNHN
jgi:predicted AAA+ superfamily ATPase